MAQARLIIRKAKSRPCDEHGLGGLNLVLVAKRFGVLSSSPYRHFRDKNELLARVALLLDPALLALGEHDWAES
jgi:AcrR family transcriptional regulator